MGFSWFELQLYSKAAISILSSGDELLHTNTLRRYSISVSFAGVTREWSSGMSTEKQTRRLIS
ncbi:hypothetical protein LINPERPRIM_LOCUS1923 [Linum perenne]